ncbi:MAG: DUF4422 domain-containing protein [Fibromonadaceae bacterium]|jgi:hypothetical protein|nr:DUF4422 domain-containing protein [Fibromonadaceae bacterium]
MKIFVYSHAERLDYIKPPYYFLHESEVKITGDSGHYYSDLNACKHIYINFKNEDYLGVWQYRKWLLNPATGNLFSEASLQALFEYLQGECKVVVSKPYRHVSIAKQFIEAHGKAMWDFLENLIKKMHPDFYKYWGIFMEEERDFYIANLYAANNKFFMNYHSWLFDILDEVDKNLDYKTGRDFYQQRVPGYFAERLFNLYLRVTKATFVLSDSNIFEATADTGEKRLRFPKN